MSATNIFEAVKTYATSWEVTNVRKFTDEELLMIKDTEIVPSDYGCAVKCFMVGGGTKFLSLGKHSRGEIGDHPDLSKARILTLTRDGEECTKVEL